MTNADYELSVIIPFYNVAFDLVKRAIDSVVFQNHINAEIILINDGSKDNYVKPLERYINGIPSIKLFSQENKGVSAARNKGIGKASGKYITLLDADDHFTEYFFEDLKRLIVNDTDYILGGTKIIRGEEAVEDYLDGEVHFFNKKDDIVKWKPNLFGTYYYFSKEHRVYLNFGVGAKVMKKSIAKSIPINESLSIGEDCLWNMQIIDRVDSLAVINRLWYLYTSNPLSATHRFNPNIIKETVDAMYCIEEQTDFKDPEERKAYVNRLFNFIVVVSKLYINNISHPLKKEERKAKEKAIYTEEPWSYILKYKQKDNLRNQIRILLYKHRLLFLFYRIRGYVRGK